MKLLILIAAFKVKYARRFAERLNQKAIYMRKIGFFVCAELFDRLSCLVPVPQQLRIFAKAMG